MLDPTHPDAPGPDSAVDRPVSRELSIHAGYATLLVHYRGIAVRVIAALRPDGDTQVSAETVSPISGREHTHFWVMHERSCAEAAEVALQETRTLLDILFEDRAADAVVGAPA